MIFKNLANNSNHMIFFFDFFLDVSSFITIWCDMKSSVCIGMVVIVYK